MALCRRNELPFHLTRVGRKALAEAALAFRLDLRARRRLGMPLRGATDEEPARDDPRIRAALGRLPPAQRQAVELRVVDELGYDEIAVAMDCSEQSARLRVSRGLRRLRSQLDCEEVL